MDEKTLSFAAEKCNEKKGDLDLEEFLNKIGTTPEWDL